MDQNRTMSLDVFRGITVFLMILVNNPGSWSHVNILLRHATWHGLLPADIVFPFFIFIMGVSIELSFRSHPSGSRGAFRLTVHVLRRTLILFLLGLFLNGFPFFPSERIFYIRIPGVLQRIAIVYCLTSFICLRGGLRFQAVVLGTLLFGYWALCAIVSVPGVGYPNIDPATNLAAWLDCLLLSGHLWNVTGSWDPEGILSSVSAVGTCMLGVWTGVILTSNNNERNKIIYLFSFGFILIMLGLVWHPLFPVNKSLWTGSFVLCTAGIASWVLACLWLIIDVKRSLWWTAPFKAMGMNSLAAFFLSSLLARTLNVINVSSAVGVVSLQSFLYRGYLASWLDPYNASLAWAFFQVVLCALVMGVMYRRRIFIKL